ncbi:MAG: hypothetical protein L0Z53_27460, partial [Acidobacteriales bacterium]|nr:hypothetical protein [Terriglobales bacterium]
AEFTPSNIPERPPLDMAYILTIGAREKSGWNDFDKAQKQGGFTFTFDGLHFTSESARRAAERIASFIRA